MAIRPDKEPAGPSKGYTRPGDQVNQPGQAEGMIPFGINSPLQTGAPGTGGAGLNPDPTVQTPIPTGIYGAATDDADTGAPGSNGASTPLKTGANYTIDAYGWYSWMDAAGGSVDTEAQGNNYGVDTGIPGLATPHTTGAPNSGDGGHVGHMHSGL
jgi:hypothetical protein